MKKDRRKEERKQKQRTKEEWERNNKLRKVRRN
jgi:hypothetical protein